MHSSQRSMQARSNIFHSSDDGHVILGSKLVQHIQSRAGWCIPPTFGPDHSSCCTSKIFISIAPEFFGTGLAAREMHEQVHLWLYSPSDAIIVKGTQCNILQSKLSSCIFHNPEGPRCIAIEVSGLFCQERGLCCICGLTSVKPCM